MNLEPAVQGDINDRRLVGLNGIDNLNAVTAVVAHIRSTRDQTGQSTLLESSVHDSADCVIEIVLGGVDGWLTTATPGSYLVEYQCTFADGSIRTWPAGRKDQIVVNPQLDPTGDPP